MVDRRPDYRAVEINLEAEVEWLGRWGLLLDYRVPPSPLDLWNHGVRHGLARKI